MNIRHFQFIIIALMYGFFSVQVCASEETHDDDSMSFEDQVGACAACHGENGDQPLAPEYPILAGQYQDYLANALRQYRDGQRTNEIMALQVEILELSDDDIEALAAHFAAKPSKLRDLAE